VSTVERLRAGGAVEVQLGEVVVRYAGPPVAEPASIEQRLDDREAELERQKAMAEERRKLEEWSAS
jgi:hypothetical protein